MKKYIIFDGNNVAHRSMPYNETAEPITMVSRALVTTRSIVHAIHPAHLIYVWDGSMGKLARRKYYPPYKMNREDHTTLEVKHELYKVLPILKTMLCALGVRQICIPRLEGDDVIAALTRDLEGNKTIVTGDTDLLQLLTNDTNMWYLPAKRIVDNRNITQYFCWPQDLLLLKKAVVGDPSDNIAGVPGVGEKTVDEVLRVCRGIVPEVIEHNDDKLPARAMKLLDKENRDIIQRNLQLMDLRYSYKYASKHVQEQLKHQPPVPNYSRWRALLFKYQLVGILGVYDSFTYTFKDNHGGAR